MVDPVLSSGLVLTANLIYIPLGRNMRYFHLYKS